MIAGYQNHLMAAAPSKVAQPVSSFRGQNYFTYGQAGLDSEITFVLIFQDIISLMLHMIQMKYKSKYGRYFFTKCIFGFSSLIILQLN